MTRFFIYKLELFNIIKHTNIIQYTSISFTSKVPKLNNRISKPKVRIKIKKAKLDIEPTILIVIINVHSIMIITMGIIDPNKMLEINDKDNVSIIQGIKINLLFNEKLI